MNYIYIFFAIHYNIGFRNKHNAYISPFPKQYHWLSKSTMVTILGFSSFLKEEFQGVIRIFWYVLEKDFHSFFQIRVYLSNKLVTIFQLSQFVKWWWSMPLLSLKKSVFFLLLGSVSKCFSHLICLNLLSLFCWSLYTFIYISHVVLLQLWMCHDHLFSLCCW